MKEFKNFTSNIGLFLILFSIVLLFFPPKYGNSWYGVSTNVTMKNNVIWRAGQKLFSYAIFLIGLLYFILGFIKIDQVIAIFPNVMSLIAFWTLAKYIINTILKKRYSKDFAKEANID